MKQHAVNEDLQANDGMTHIRLSPQGNTELGRQLHMGAHREIYDPRYGYFSSIVAFWVWYESGMNDALRGIHHDNMIRSSLSGLEDRAGTRQIVTQILRNSIIDNPELSQKLKESTLPFVSYEVLNLSNTESTESFIMTNNREWYINALYQIRTELQSGA